MIKTLIVGVAAATLLAGAPLCANAAPNPYNGGNNGYGQNHGYGQNNGNGQAHRGWGRDMGNSHRWRNGERMGYNDWNQARRVDWRQHHLRQPPRGYEWREANGQYVLAAITTGLIFSIIANSGH